jgi:hypothetical protein
MEYDMLRGSQVLMVKVVYSLLKAIAKIGPEWSLMWGPVIWQSIGLTPSVLTIPGM